MTVGARINSPKIRICKKIIQYENRMRTDGNREFLGISDFFNIKYGENTPFV
jgi:hypothetical protein